jgi:hypothetical protein
MAAVLAFVGADCLWWTSRHGQNYHRASRARCVRIAGGHLRIYTIEQALRSTPDWGQAVGEFGYLVAYTGLRTISVWAGRWWQTPSIRCS